MHSEVESAETDQESPGYTHSQSDAIRVLKIEQTNLLQHCYGYLQALVDKVVRSVNEISR